MNYYFLLSLVILFFVYPETECEKDTFNQFYNFVLSRFPKYRKPQKQSYSTLILNRNSFRYGSQNYKNWTEWSTCDPNQCIKTRSRECKDNSWRRQIRPHQIHFKCPVKVIIESLPCNDTELCRTDTVKLNGSSLTTKLPEKCGIRPERIQTKIFGGKEAERNSWPWHVGLYFVGYDKMGMKKRVYLCGATLINEGWVLTTAHCLTSIKGGNRLPNGRLIDTRRVKLFDQFLLVLGDHDRNDKDTKIFAKFSHFIIHPEFRADWTTNAYDAALLKLDVPIRKQKAIDFACLPPQPDYTLNMSSTCIAIGWGLIESREPVSIWSVDFDMIDEYKYRQQSVIKQAIKLHEVQIPLVDIDRCRDNYRFFNFDNDIHVCAGSNSKDTCRGDSGGGLFCQDGKGKKWILYGLTNFGSVKGCGKNYGVYVKASALLEWIKTSIKKNI